MRLADLLARLRRVRRCGNGYVALCPAHNDRHPSLSITQVDKRILLYCFRGCSVQTICEVLGIRVSDLFSSHDSQSNTTHYSDAERREFARAIWRKSLRADGTVVEQYLRNRGITISIPPALRFLPLVRHAEYGYSFPALVAGIQGANSQFAAVSITWLCADGSDKAPAEPQRKILGPYRGSTVRLAEASTTLAIAEGIETALSIQQATQIPTWAALSVSNLARVELPVSVREVIVCADADPAGEHAALILAQRLLREGREVRIGRPCRRGADFNDLRL